MAREPRLGRVVPPRRRHALLPLEKQLENVVLGPDVLEDEARLHHAHLLPLELASADGPSAASGPSFRPTSGVSCPPPASPSALTASEPGLCVASRTPACRAPAPGPSQIPASQHVAARSAFVEPSSAEHRTAQDPRCQPDTFTPPPSVALAARWAEESARRSAKPPLPPARDVPRGSPRTAPGSAALPPSSRGGVGGTTPAAAACAADGDAGRGFVTPGPESYPVPQALAFGSETPPDSVIEATPPLPEASRPGRGSDASAQEMPMGAGAGTPGLYEVDSDGEDGSQLVISQVPAQPFGFDLSDGNAAGKTDPPRRGDPAGAAPAVRRVDAAERPLPDLQPAATPPPRVRRPDAAAPPGDFDFYACTPGGVIDASQSPMRATPPPVARHFKPLPPRPSLYTPVSAPARPPAPSPASAPHPAFFPRPFVTPTARPIRPTGPQTAPAAWRGTSAYTTPPPGPPAPQARPVQAPRPNQPGGPQFHAPGRPAAPPPAPQTCQRMPAPAPVAQPAAGGPAGFAWGSGRTIQLDADAVARGRAAIGLDEDDGAAALDAGGGGGAAGAGEAQALDVAPGLAGFGWATGRKIEVDRQAIARGQALLGLTDNEGGSQHDDAAPGAAASAQEAGHAQDGRGSGGPQPPAQRQVQQASGGGDFPGFGWANGTKIQLDAAAIARGKAMMGLEGDDEAEDDRAAAAPADAARSAGADAGGGVAAAGGFTGFGWATGRTIAVDEAAIAKGKAMLGLDGGGDDDNNESGGGEHGPDRPAVTPQAAGTTPATALQPAVRPVHPSASAGAAPARTPPTDAVGGARAGSADKRQAFQTPFAGKRIPFASPLAASAAAKARAPPTAQRGAPPRTSGFKPPRLQKKRPAPGSAETPASAKRVAVGGAAPAPGGSARPTLADVRGAPPSGMMPLVDPLPLTSAAAAAFRFPAGAGAPAYGPEEAQRELVGLGVMAGGSVPEGWMAQQWRWVVWKLAAQELKLPAARGLRLTRATVQKQLCDRYRREIAGGQRPSLRRILNGDSPASLPLVLMVSHVDFPPAVVDPDAEQGAEEPALVLPPPRVELSDGWYCVRAEVDPPLARLFRQERIVEGDKLHVRGAQLSCNNPGEPWEVGESVSLRVNCNATSPAAWDARLGFQRPDITLTRLDHVHPDGGVVPACVFAVQAVGPLLMYERGASSGKQQGSAAANEAQAGVFRTAKADSVAESLHAGIVTREAEKASTQARGEERAWCERVARGQARASPAERAYASTMLSADGGGAGDVGDATEAEMHAVFACRQDAVGKRAEELLKRSLEKLRVPQQRDVSPAIVVVAAAVFPEGASRGSFPDAPLAQLRIWRPDDALTSQLKPGAVIVGTMLAPRGGAGRRRDLPLLLQTTRSTSMHVVGTLPVAGVTSAYEPVLVHSTASLLGVAEPAAGWCTRRGGVDCGQGAASVMRRSPSLFALVGVAVGASQVTPLEHGRLGQWVFVCDAGPGTAHGQTRWLTAVHVTGYPESGAFVAEGMCGVVAFEALEVHPLGRDAKNGLVRAAVGAGTRVWQAAPPGGGEAWRAAETWARSAEGRQVVEGLRAEVGQLVRGGSR